MPHPYYPAGNPKFNHVALSVPSDLLDETNRADLCRYFSKVLGFDEMPTETIDRKRLILACVHWDQFIFLVANDEPCGAPAPTTTASPSAPVTTSSRPATGRWPSGSVTPASTSTTSRSTTRAWSRSIPSMSATCCP